MKLRPLGDRVVIKPVEREEKTKSGIVLPDTAKEKAQEGMIEAAGNGRFIETTGKREPLDVKVGDRVGYAKYAGRKIKLDEAEYLGLRFHELLVIASQGGELIRSAGTEVEDVKGEQDVLAALEGREGNGIAVGCPRQGEIGRQVPNTGHVRRGRRHRPIVVR